MKKVKRIIALFACAALLSVSCVFCLAAPVEVNGCNWMSVIEDKTSLADISMPGTHDTAATYVAFGIAARCQHKVIPEQLNCGARFLDIRLRKDGEQLKLVHNFINCRKGSGFSAPKLYFDDVTGYCIDFLEKNPGETILLFVKRDSGSGSGFEDILLDYIAQNPSKWYTENRVPKLGEVRGKMVLLNRFSGADTALNDQNGGINLSNFPSHAANEGSYQTLGLDSFSGSMISSYTVQDHYKYPKEDKWEQGILPTLEEEKTPGGLLINFFSTASGISPEINAKYINKQALAYNFKHDKCYGAVLFDFITPDLAKAVYSCNDAVRSPSAQGETGVEMAVPDPQDGSIKFLDSFWAFLISLFS